jgi:hypothetical protein
LRRRGKGDWVGEMKTVYILGAGGFGRELYWWLMQSPENGKAWKVAGFLDDNADALKGFDYPVGIVGSVMGYRPQPGDLLACAITQPKVKKPVVEALVAKGAEFLTFVHPKAHLGGNVKIGRGSVICPGVVMTCDIAIGDFTTINVNSTVGHDARVGHFCLINSHCDGGDGGGESGDEVEVVSRTKNEERRTKGRGGIERRRRVKGRGKTKRERAGVRASGSGG